jgi:anti-sigma factor RsiW
MSATRNPVPEPDDIEALLPWHAAGTLSRREAERVERALAQDAELARRYALVREEMAETIHLNETLGAPSPRALDDLFAKIDAEPVRHPRVPTLSARVSGFLAGLTPRTLAWSAAAAVLLIVLQAGLIAGIVLNERSPGDYQTASAPTAAPTPGAQALIRFRAQASASDVTTFLESHGLSIVGGPSAGGLYRVRIGDKNMPKATRDALIRTLQQDKVVGFIAATE